MPYIPHTEREVADMLKVIGVTSIEDLFSEIPAELRIDALNNVPKGLTAFEATRLLQHKAVQDQHALNFIGAGAYEHHIPAAVFDVAFRGEFMTAYTPYQAEASQGTLQLIYEYQTMIASLMGLDVSNASLYDGATSVAEAILMAARVLRTKKTSKVLVPRTLHPYYRKTLNAIVRMQGIELIDLPYDVLTGQTDIACLKEYAAEEITAVLIPASNFFGVVEPVDALTDFAHQQKALAVAVVNPHFTTVFKEPGQWGETGADIACGEGQPLGVPMSSGGPYFGFMCCKKEFVRQMPGRIVGRTLDRDGKQGFVLTLQAREQHIRRAKATSNICTNQGLMVTMATIYMSLMGEEGLRQIALSSIYNTSALCAQACAIPGVKKLFSGDHFHEVVLQLPVPAGDVVEQFALRDIQAGFLLSEEYHELTNCILVCVTETKSAEDIALFVSTLEKVVTKLLNSVSIA
jgi:glycine dehydrogenase subunit 1